MIAPFISLENISKTFGGVRSLTNVNMSFAKGEAIALAGENGSGKSTLIKILSGAHAASAGDVVIDGRRHYRLRPIDAVRAGIQIIYQDFSLFSNLTAAENIVFSHQLSARRRWVHFRQMREMAGAALDRLRVSIDLDAKVEDLPVASKQLIAIARALLNDARLIVMDEPTTALTQTEVRNLLSIIRRLKADGVCVVFVSHKLQELFSVCDRVTVLRNGEKVAEGAVEDFTPASLTKHMTGRDIPESRRETANKMLGDVVLRVERLSRGKQFSEVSFTMRAGEVVGLGGLLGSGRTELAKSIFGLSPSKSGRIEICGLAAPIASPGARIAQGIGYVPEDRLTEGLFFGQSVATNTRVGLLDQFSGPFGGLKKRALLDVVANWLRRFKVKGSPEQPIHSLSGGNQQRVLLARWLAREPKILILNGPSVGVDVGSKADIHQIICEFAETGTATLLISDDLSELVSCCDRVLIMNKGAITQDIGGADLSEARLAQAIAG